ncbi:hypothetical protein [Mycobacterium sp. SMC-17]|uniref:hypothetical protein n=1 Tax=Mycobacterium sp. SMC-17 TaxID=3381628 RepID=UPI003877885C
MTTDPNKATDPDETALVSPAPQVDPDKTSMVTPFSSSPQSDAAPQVNPTSAPTPAPQWQPAPVPPAPQPTSWTPPPPQWTPPPTASAAPPAPPAPPINPAPQQYGAPQYAAPQSPPGAGPQQQWPGAPGPQHPGAGFGGPQQPGAPYPGGPYPGAAQPNTAFGQPNAGFGQPNPGFAASGFPGAAGPTTPQSPGELASNLIGKGNTFLTRLMQRGMQGELIKAPWFQAFRQSPDQFMLISYIVVAVLVLLLSYGGGLIGSVLSLAFWAGLAYTFFAIGTLKAHKWVANGIGYGGAAIALVGTIDPITALIDFSDYAPTSLGLRLGVNIAISVIVAAVLGLAGYLVNKEIKRLTTNPF